MQNEKLDAEINLMPIISLLAVLISFLLISAVWVNIGSLDISQAVGPQGKTEPTWSVSANFDAQGDLQLLLFSPKDQNGYPWTKIKRKNFEINWKRFEDSIQKLKRTYPDLMTGVVLPKTNSPYEDVIRVIDIMKRHQITDIGISPI